MNANHFIWWLTGFMEATEFHKRDGIEYPAWNHIKEILSSVTCWEIELGKDK